MLAIAFALRGTLTRTDFLEHTSFIELWRERCAALQHPFVDETAAAAARELFSSASPERVPPAHVAGTLVRLLGDTVAEAVLVARFRQIAGRSAPHHVTSTADVRVTLERIESLGIPMAVLCNGWSRIAQSEATCAGFNGPVLVSEDLHCEAPDRRAFDKLIETVGVPAERVWFVGNDPQRDIDGAVRAGLTAVWFNPDDAPYPAAFAPPALIVRSFEELLPPLCEEYTRSLLSLRNVMRTALDWRDGHYLPGSE